MISLDILFITLPLTIIVGSPPYLLYRQRTRNYTQSFTTTKIIRFVVLIFLIGMPIVLQFIRIFILLNKSNNLAFTIFFILSLLIAFYGVGFYTSSLILETFVSHKILEFFHGTFSHILMHWGMFLAVLSFALCSHNYAFKLFIPQNIMVILWAVAGFFHAISQIFNKTYYYQLIGGLLCLTIFFLVKGNLSLLSSIELYFLSFFIIFNFVLFIYLFIKK